VHNIEICELHSPRIIHGLIKSWRMESKGL